MSVAPASSSPRVIALVPLRGGSKSILLKNIKPIAGKPLCIWSLAAALEAGIFGEIIVSTDDSRIAKVVKQHLPDIRVVDRPAELATDTASTESVMHHIAEKVPFDVLCTIQATSPLTTGADLTGAWEQFRESGADSLVTAVRTKRFFWNDDGTPINYDPLNRPRRQEFEGTLMENGAFYFTTRETLKRTGSRLGCRISVYEMPEDTAAEIDEPEDWLIIERLLQRRASLSVFPGEANMDKGTDTDTDADAVATPEIRTRIRTIRWVFFDVDGTLTDGAMYYSVEGEALKRFSTRDGMGLRRLQEAGINVGIITSEDSAIARARAAKLKIDTVFTGVHDKAARLRSFAADHGLTLDQIALMGDDLNDLPAMEIVGLAACPADAVPEVRNQARFIAHAGGGNGAVREFCEWLIAGGKTP
ncbi:MAG: N-acylneuraminate cytidylyltransferase [Alkalispirochaeta sp.]